MEAIEPLLMKLQICPHQLLFSMVAICFYLPVFDCVCVSVWRGGGGAGKPLLPTILVGDVTGSSMCECKPVS